MKAARVSGLESNHKSIQHLWSDSVESVICLMPDAFFPYLSVEDGTGALEILLC